MLEKGILNVDCLVTPTIIAGGCHKGMRIGYLGDSVEWCGGIDYKTQFIGVEIDTAKLISALSIDLTGKVFSVPMALPLHLFDNNQTNICVDLPFSTMDDTRYTQEGEVDMVYDYMATKVKGTVPVILNLYTTGVFTNVRTMLEFLYNERLHGITSNNVYCIGTNMGDYTYNGISFPTEESRALYILNEYNINNKILPYSIVGKSALWHFYTHTFVNDIIPGCNNMIPRLLDALI